jgi:hypothetical protein
MTEDHPNISLLRSLDLENKATVGDHFAHDVVWHF